MQNYTDWLRTMPIAQRGLHDNISVAENSKTAISKAIDANYALELDVNFTKDNVPIIFHDNLLSRMTNLDGYVNLTDFESIKNGKLLKQEDSVLSLNEALTLVSSRVPILFNIAGTLPISVCKNFYDAVKDYPGEIAVESTNPYTLEWFKLNAPRIKRGQRAGAYRHEKPTFANRHKLRKLKLNHISEPNFVVYRVEDAKKRYFRKLYKNETPLIVWTVRSKKDNRKADSLKANKIFQLPTLIEL